MAARNKIPIADEIIGFLPTAHRIGQRAVVIDNFRPVPARSLSISEARSCAAFQPLCVVSLLGGRFSRYARNCADEIEVQRANLMAIPSKKKKGPPAPRCHMHTGGGFTRSAFFVSEDQLNAHSDHLLYPSQPRSHVPDTILFDLGFSIPR